MRRRTRCAWHGGSEFQSAINVGKKDRSLLLVLHTAWRKVFFRSVCDQLFLGIFYAIFTQDASLLFLYNGQQSKKWPKPQIERFLLRCRTETKTKTKHTKTHMTMASEQEHFLLISHSANSLGQLFVSITVGRTTEQNRTELASKSTTAGFPKPLRDDSVAFSCAHFISFILSSIFCQKWGNLKGSGMEPANVIFYVQYPFHGIEPRKIFWFGWKIVSFFYCFFLWYIFRTRFLKFCMEIQATRTYAVTKQR